MVSKLNTIIRRGTAYIPTLAKGGPRGPYIKVNPIFNSNLTVDNLLQIFEQVIIQGHPPIDPPRTREDWKKINLPLLAAMGVKNWQHVVKDSAHYHITWVEDAIILYLHTLTQNGRRLDFGFDPVNRAITFPLDTPLRTLAEAILDDVHKLPELGYVDVTQPK